jgi:DNA-binding GntR family transcriptional regulator
MTPTELRRLSELRSLLEGFAARHATTHAATSPEKLKQLRSILKRLPIARVGYRDVSRFGQHFKRLFEATPAAYRVAEQR